MWQIPGSGTDHGGMEMETTAERTGEMHGPSRTSRETFLARPTHALWAAGGMLALVVLIAILVPAGPLGLDHSWSDAMRRLETPVLTDLALAFNWLGRGLGRALGLTLVGVLLLRRRRWLALAAFAVAESLAPLLSDLLKALTDRPRPPDGLIHAAGSSFPSGHATYAGATSVALVLLFTTPGTRRRLWWALAVLGVVGMAWSRTYLQVHWLTDVIAGALLGSGISLLVFAISQRHQSWVMDEVLSRRLSRLPAGRTRVARRRKTRPPAATRE
jgi:membrane-associated phospholipid phosphatase